MSDRYYTGVKVSGPSADAAAQSVRETQINEEGRFAGFEWLCLDVDYVDGVAVEPPPGDKFKLFDHGMESIAFILQLSEKFPTETFYVCVSGPCDSPLFQGHMTIQNGVASDVHTDDPWCGHFMDDDINVKVAAFFNSWSEGKKSLEVLLDAGDEFDNILYGSSDGSSDSPGNGCRHCIEARSDASFPETSRPEPSASELSENDISMADVLGVGAAQKEAKKS